MGANGTTVAGMYYSFAFPYFCNNVLSEPDSVDALNSMDSSAGGMMRPARKRERVSRRLFGQNLLDTNFMLCR